MDVAWNADYSNMTIPNMLFEPELENLSDRSHMLLHREIKSNQILSKYSVKDLINKPLEGRRCVHKAKGHNKILIVSGVPNEYSLSFIQKKPCALSPENDLDIAQVLWAKEDPHAPPSWIRSESGRLDGSSTP